MAKELPKIGYKIPIEKFHVSEMNMRFGEPFPADEQDEVLIANLRARKGKTAELIMARPEGDGFGVYQGRRKFLALKHIAMKQLVVGEHCLITDVTDEEAADASWIENVDFLRKSVDPITRAKKLNERLSFSGLTLTQLAAHDGVGKSTYSEWLAMERLSPKMKEVVSKGENLLFTDALEVAKMDLGKELQDELAETAEKEGREAFKKRLATVPTAGRRRGIPGGVYEVDRVMWDKRSKKDMEDVGVLDKAAKKKGFVDAKTGEAKRPEYIKNYIRRHIGEIRKEGA